MIRSRLSLRELERLASALLADRAVLDRETAQLLSLQQGRDLYMAHVRRPAVFGGAEPGTLKRYRAVLDKFLPYCEQESVPHWQSVTKKVVEGYGAWLDDQDYAYATEYLEITTIKQILKWLVEEKHVPATCLFSLPLEKPHGTTTYCYKQEEVEAIVAHCLSQDDLIWLGHVVLALTRTGLRIAELAQLSWADFDFQANVLRLTDARRQGGKKARNQARSTKSHRNRVLPLDADLRTVLLLKKRHPDGRVFHGPLGGQLKPDTVRNVLIREVLKPLEDRFPVVPRQKGFKDGRLHSFRHFFCSTCANSGVPEQVVMAWLGHQDSRMVKHYYHLHDAEAQRQMAKIQFTSPSRQRETGSGA